MSKTKLKPLNEQVMVITGASSGIGLATARLAAKRGARVVLAARSEETTSHLAHDINAAGGEAVFFACDVGDRGQVEQLVRTTVEHFGQIDTWVNNAGVSIYGRLDEVSEQDSRMLFETNFWGVYHGSMAVLPHLKINGGALINVGSEVSESAVPMQGMYTASKHAVKGFTDALRVEIEEVDHAPISITLIQPTATDTPFPHHAKNYMEQEPQLQPPLDDPEDVAEAILRAAASPTRSKKVGALSKLNVMTARLAPKLADKLAAKRVNQQKSNEQPRNPEGILEQSSEAIGVVGQVHGDGAR